jgi:hypothetical protein
MSRGKTHPCIGNPVKEPLNDMKNITQYIDLFYIAETQGAKQKITQKRPA